MYLHVYHLKHEQGKQNYMKTETGMGTHKICSKPSQLAIALLLITLIDLHNIM